MRDFFQKLIDSVAQTTNWIYDSHTLRRNGRTTMERKNTMNGRHAKRQNCSLQTTKGNCKRGRDNDGIRNVVKQYYARIIVHRLAGDGATIYFYFFSCGPRSARGFCEPGSEPARIFSGSGTHDALNHSQYWRGTGTTARIVRNKSIFDPLEEERFWILSIFFCIANIFSYKWFCNSDAGFLFSSNAELW